MSQQIRRYLTSTLNGVNVDGVTTVMVDASFNQTPDWPLSQEDLGPDKNPFLEMSQDQIQKLDAVLSSEQAKQILGETSAQFGPVASEVLDKTLLEESLSYIMNGANLAMLAGSKSEDFLQVFDASSVPLQVAAPDLLVEDVEVEMATEILAEEIDESDVDVGFIERCIALDHTYCLMPVPEESNEVLVMADVVEEEEETVRTHSIIEEDLSPSGKKMRGRLSGTDKGDSVLVSSPVRRSQRQIEKFEREQLEKIKAENAELQRREKEEMLRLKQLEEEQQQRLLEEEEQRQKLLEEENLKKLLEEEEQKRKLLEEGEQKRKLLEEEEQKRKLLEEEERKQKLLEEEKLQQLLEEETLPKLQQSEQDKVCDTGPEDLGAAVGPSVERAVPADDQCHVKTDAVALVPPARDFTLDSKNGELTAPKLEATTAMPPGESCDSLAQVALQEVEDTISAIKNEIAADEALSGALAEEERRIAAIHSLSLESRPPPVLAPVNVVSPPHLVPATAFEPLPTKGEAQPPQLLPVGKAAKHEPSDLQDDLEGGGPPTPLNMEGAEVIEDIRDFVNVEQAKAETSKLPTTASSSPPPPLKKERSTSLDKLDEIFGRVVPKRRPSDVKKGDGESKSSTKQDTIRKSYPKRENRKPPPYLMDMLEPALFSKPDRMKKIDSRYDYKSEVRESSPSPSMSRSAATSDQIDVSTDSSQEKVTETTTVADPGFRKNEDIEDYLSKADGSVMTVEIEQQDGVKEVLEIAGTAVSEDIPEEEEKPPIPPVVEASSTSRKMRKNEAKDKLRQRKLNLMKEKRKKLLQQKKKKRAALKKDGKSAKRLRAKQSHRRTDEALKDSADDESEEDDDEDDSGDSSSWCSEDDPDRLWCICKQPHNDRFMIRCDSCEDWFHGSCVGITRKAGRELERSGKEWVCRKCTKERLQKKEGPKAGLGQQKGDAKTPRSGSGKAPKAAALQMPVLTPVSSTTVPAVVVAPKVPQVLLQPPKAAPQQPTTIITPSKVIQVPPSAPKAVAPPSTPSIKVSQPLSPGDDTDNKEKAPRIPKMPRPTLVVAEKPTPQQCIRCGRPARPNSIFCGNECILQHADESLKVIGKDRQKKPAIKKPELQKKVPGSADRVVVIERRTGRVLTGPKAPTEQNLHDWLKLHPTFEVLRTARGVPQRRFYGEPRKMIKLISAQPMPVELPLENIKGKSLMQRSASTEKKEEKKPMAMEPKTKATTMVEIRPKMTLDPRAKLPPFEPKTIVVMAGKPAAPIVTPRTGPPQQPLLPTPPPPPPLPPVAAAATVQKPAQVVTALASIASIPKPPPMTIVKPNILASSKLPSPSMQLKPTATATPKSSPAAEPKFRPVVTPETKPKLTVDTKAKLIPEPKVVPPATPPPTTPQQASPGPEPVRLNVRKTLSDILASRSNDADDIQMSNEEIQKITTDIEEELFKLFNDVGAKYKAKYRSLIFNIKDPRNNGLFRKILRGKIQPNKLVRMTPEELASKELAMWRERETKHTLEMIKREQEEQQQHVPIIKKTHKGEIEIDDDDIGFSDKPKNKLDAVSEVSSPIVMDTTEAHRSHLFDLNCKICTGKMLPPSDGESPTKKARVAKSISLESKSQDEDSEDENSQVSLEEKSKEDQSIEKEPSNKESKPKEKDKNMETKKNESGAKKNESGAKKNESETRKNESGTRKNESGTKKSKNKDKEQKSKSKESHKKSKSKDGDKKEKTKDGDRKEKSNKVGSKKDKSKDGSNSIKKAKKIVKVTKEPTSTTKQDSADREPSSTVTIGSPDSAQPSQSDDSKSAHPSVWKGFVMMQDVAKFVTNAYKVSGPTDFLGQDIPDTIQVCGRIAPNTVWDYLSKVKQSGNKEFLVIRFSPANEEEKVAYVSFYSYLSSRNRFGVVGNSSKMIKDFYILPLAAHSSVPATLLPFDGPGLEETRPHMLLGVIVRHRGKRRAVEADSEKSGKSTKRKLTVDSADTSNDGSDIVMLSKDSSSGSKKVKFDLSVRTGTLGDGDLPYEPSYTPPLEDLSKKKGETGSSPYEPSFTPPLDQMPKKDGDDSPYSPGPIEEDDSNKPYDPEEVDESVKVPKGIIPGLLTGSVSSQSVSELIDQISMSSNPTEITTTVLASIATATNLEQQRKLLIELTQKVEEQKRQLEMQKQQIATKVTAQVMGAMAPFSLQAPSLTGFGTPVTTGTAAMLLPLPPASAAAGSTQDTSRTKMPPALGTFKSAEEDEAYSPSYTPPPQPLTTSAGSSTAVVETVSPMPPPPLKLPDTSSISLPPNLQEILESIKKQGAAAESATTSSGSVVTSGAGLSSGTAKDDGGTTAANVSLAEDPIVKKFSGSDAPDVGGGHSPEVLPPGIETADRRDEDSKKQSDPRLKRKSLQADPRIKTQEQQQPPPPPPKKTGALSSMSASELMEKALKQFEGLPPPPKPATPTVAKGKTASRGTISIKLGTATTANLSKGSVGSPPAVGAQSLSGAPAEGAASFPPVVAGFIEPPPPGLEDNADKVSKDAAAMSSQMAGAGPPQQMISYPIQPAPFVPTPPPPAASYGGPPPGFGPPQAMFPAYQNPYSTPNYWSGRGGGGPQNQPQQQQAPPHPHHQQQPPPHHHQDWRGAGPPRFRGRGRGRWEGPRGGGWEQHSDSGSDHWASRGDKDERKDWSRQDRDERERFRDRDERRDDRRNRNRIRGRDKDRSRSRHRD